MTKRRLLQLIVVLLALIWVAVVPPPFEDCDASGCSPTWWPARADRLAWWPDHPIRLHP